MSEYEMSEEDMERIEEIQTHVVYCPDCRSEQGRYDDKEDAAEARYIHHIGTGHSPKILTGVYND